MFTANGPADESTAPSTPPVVATYGNSTVTLSEFERAYANAGNINAQENQNPAADSLGAYKKFLEQYIDYRLKVRAAREAGLDTLSSVRSEIRSYRQEMARPKLMESEVYRPVIREVHERRQKEVDVSHILIRAPSDAPARKEQQAYQKIQSIADSIERGVSFADLAYRNSDDPSAQKQKKRGYRGRIGYIRAGQIVKPFEDRMYSVPPDSVSDVFRTKYGYHILKVHDRRPAKPALKLSHIMLRRSATGDSAKRSRQLLDSLRTEIVQNGANFGALAKEYSDDRRSASRGGALGKVESIEALPASFQQVVPKLDTVGAVSNVIETKYGYHLVELTDRVEPPTLEEAYERLKKNVSQSRFEERKTEYAAQVRTETGVTVDTTRLLQVTNASSLDTLSRPLLSPTTSPGQDNANHTPIATLGDSSYTLDQLSQHLMDADGGAQMTIGEVVEDFLNEKAFQYAVSRLEERDSSFAATMKQYREGLLVFQFMQDSVWTVAAQDTAGLRRTYQQQKDQYRYPDRVRTIVLRSSADSLLTPYTSARTDTRSVSEILNRAKNDSLVTVDTTLVTEESAEVYHRVFDLEDGRTAGPLKRENNPILLVRDTLLPSRQKTFSEARSRVIRDYQDIYEDEVMTRLRRRYDVETHPERLRHAYDGETPATASTP